jgi:hypothetical protein
MKVLLINTNPVVSRLTSLSARKENIKLDEIKEITELKNNSNYNIIFVDFDSLTKEVIDFLEKSKAKKKVCFYTKDDNEKEIEGIFNFHILKPFLPSEVSAIIRDCKIEMEKEIEQQEEAIKEENMVSLDELISQKDDLKIIDIPKEKEEIKIDTTLPNKTKKEEIKTIKPQEKEEKKEETIILGTIPQKEVIEETKEKIETKKDKLEEKVEETLELFEIDNDNNKKEEKKENIELFEPNLKDEESENIKNQEENSIFDLDIDSKNELDFDIIKENNNNSTKILDKEEISNIKSLLNNNEETQKDLSLDDILASSAPIDMSLPKKEKKKKKKKSKKRKKSIQENEKKEAVEVLTDTIKALPVEELRQLLRGTKIYITIEFPDK